jgi:hypothetical protein
MFSALFTLPHLYPAPQDVVSGRSKKGALNAEFKAVWTVVTSTSKSYISARGRQCSSARERRGGQGARSSMEGFARIESPMVMGVAQMSAVTQGL